MRVSDAKAQEMADAPLHCIYPPKMVNHVALDLLDARATIAAKDARIKELEAEAAKLSACWRDEELAHTITIDQRDQHEERLNDLFSALGMSERESQWSSANDPSEVAKERASELVTRIAALEAQLAEAKRVGAIEELERLAGKVGHQFTGTMHYTSSDLLARAAALRGEVKG